MDADTAALQSFSLVPEPVAQTHRSRASYCRDREGVWLSRGGQQGSPILPIVGHDNPIRNDAHSFFVVTSIYDPHHITLKYAYPSA